MTTCTRPNQRPAGLLLDVAAHGRTTTVRLFGVVDAVTARRLRRVAGMGSVRSARLVTIDIERVTVADVAGWCALRQLAADLTDRGTTVVQVGCRGRDVRVDDLLHRLGARSACA
ncbi:MAG TPA: STAS domain-containing protein [Iamia sp.]